MPQSATAMLSDTPESEPDLAEVLDLDLEQKLKLVGLGHLIPKVRELERRIDPKAMDLLDKLLVHRAKQNRVNYDSWLRKMGKHYAALYLDPSASEGEIKRRYRRLARLHHPDVGGDKESMQLITEAYSAILADLRNQHS